MKKLFLPLIVPLAVFVYGASPYATGYADSDEFILLGHTGGVAHPAGYPLVVLLSGLFQRLLFFLPHAYASNLLSAAIHSLSLYFLYLTLIKFLRHTKVIHVPPHIRNLAALIAIYTIGFSTHFWLYSSVIEVVSVTSLLLSLTVYFAYSWYTVPSQDYLYLTVIFAALGLTHIPSFILIYPLLLAFLILKSSRLNLSTLQKGLIVYSFAFCLPLALLFYFNSRQADASWYFPPSVSGITRFITRKDYTGFYNEENKTRTSYVENVSQKFLPSQPILAKFTFDSLTPLGIIFLALGLWYIFKFPTIDSSLFLSMSLLTGPVFAGLIGLPDVTKNPNEILNFGVAVRQFLIFEFFLAFIIALGFIHVFKFLSKSYPPPKVKSLLIQIFLVALSFQISQNQSVGVQRQNNLMELYARGMLDSSAPGSLIVCTGDPSCFSLLVASYVYRLRPDVTILTKEYIYSHYYLQKHPQTYPFSYTQNPFYYPNLLAWNISRRPTYITQPDQFYINEMGLDNNPFTITPQGMLFQISTQSGSLSTESLKTPALDKLLLEPPDPRDYFHHGLQFMFAGFLNLQATIFSHTNKTAALVTLERALNLNSINPDTHALLRNLASGVIADPPDQNEFTVDKLFTSAQKQIQSEELDLAYSNLKKALYLQPESLELRLELAQLLSYGGYGDLALLELQNARTLHPNSAQVDALAAYLSTQSATPKKTLVQ